MSTTRHSTRHRLRTAAVLALGVLPFVAVACGSSSGSSAKPADKTSSTTASTAPVDLRLGYFPNVTHAPALIGIQGKIFEKYLGKNVTLKPQSFNAGPDVTTAIFSGALICSARHSSSTWKIIVARFSNTIVTCGPTDTRRTRFISMTRLRRSSRMAAYSFGPRISARVSFRIVVAT